MEEELFGGARPDKAGLNKWLDERKSCSSNIMKDGASCR